MNQNLLAEWHQAVGEQPQDSLPHPLGQLRSDLVLEEATEAAAELWQSESRARIGKELADLLYVAYGAAYLHDIPLDACLAEVHRSNMTKLEAGISRRSDGKILKGEKYQEADIEKVLDEHRKKGTQSNS